MNELDFLAEFLVESDAIEGIENDPESVKESLSAALSGKEYLSRGHAGALALLRRWADRGGRFGLDEWLVRFIQLLIVQEQPEKGGRQLPKDQVGKWRKHAVTIVERNSHGEVLCRRPIGVESKEIPERMKELLRQVREWLSAERVRTAEEKIRFVAWFHWSYERIHPFADGNGRSGRALVYFMYRRLGLEPFIFTNVDKREKYYPCFSGSSSVMMERYFLDRSPATL